MRFVILGGSGSGKSTQAQRLCRHFDIPLISTGEILREAIELYSRFPNANLSSNGRHVQPYVEKGELVPDETTINFIRTRLNKDDINNGWVLEGYPRTAFQAEELDFFLNDLQQKLDWAISTLR